ncbi:MAG: hypothetical protein H0V01_01720 [Bacteroidetes bacterium]|nr:hypothetical protein [Bacteroidota bacterium]HET6243260.1 hypothetical protein [Bacteroidia bacterium]
MKTPTPAPMKQLSKNWLTEKHIDFEYKKYVLLAYLSDVSNSFEQNLLYPCFSEIIDHYKNIMSVKENKKLISDAFPSKLQKIDLESFDMEYEKIIKDSDLFEELEQIINFSIPKFEYYLNEGKKIFDLIENNTTISSIGVVPLNADYGYMLLNNGINKKTYVYEYRTTIFEASEDKYRGLHTIFIETYKRNFSTTFEFIKSDLIRKKRDLLNPATYAMETDLEIPLNETFLPIAKRMLIKHISETA